MSRSYSSGREVIIFRSWVALSSEIWEESADRSIGDAMHTYDSRGILVAGQRC